MWDNYVSHKLKECYDYCNLIMAYNFCQFVHLAKVVIFFLKIHGLHWNPPPPPIFLWKFHKITKVCHNSWSFLLCKVDLATKKNLVNFCPFIFLLKKNCEEKHVFKSVKCVFLAKNKYLSEKKKIPKWTIEIGN